jgi:hypothetical protein
MKAASYSSKESAPSAEILDGLDKLAPDLILTFFSVGHAKDPSFLKALWSRYPKALIAGCSTAGEITNSGVYDESVSIVAMKFGKTKLKPAHAVITANTTSSQAGAKIAKELAADDLAGIFVLCPGVNINGSEFLKGTLSVLGKEVPVSGGLAGDGLNFKQTYTFFNGNIYENQAVAIGFYGDALEYKTGSRGGWSPFGPARRVTKSEGNVLFELDGESALKLYKEYLGDKAEELPSSGLLYPFAILQEDHSELGLIRTILNVDHEKGSLILAGDLPEGSLVCLMHADIDNLIQGAEVAATEAKAEGTGDSAAFLVSCVGRKILMTDDVIEEIEAVKNTIGENVAMAGFYSYGEICPFVLTSQPELHNQTMTVTHIAEKA